MSELRAIMVNAVVLSAAGESRLLWFMVVFLGRIRVGMRRKTQGYEARSGRGRARREVAGRNAGRSCGDSSRG
jgi:hypothetical protein